MVQDTSYGQELYLAKRRNGKCGGWGLADSTDVDGNDTNFSHLMECTVIWAVSVPGESMWYSREMDGVAIDDGAFILYLHLICDL
jgi:hypothetical protein